MPHRVATPSPRDLRCTGSLHLLLCKRDTEARQKERAEPVTCPSYTLKYCFSDDFMDLARQLLFRPGPCKLAIYGDLLK